MVPQVLVQVVQEGPLPSTGQQNLLQGLIWVRVGAARSPWAVRAMSERVLVLVPIVPQVLEQTLKPDQPEALASTEQVL